VKVLGTVGEPINPEAWLWYHRVVGGQQCSIVDTYWQTETGGHLLTPLPGAVQTKPGSACFPFFGVEPEILDEVEKCLQIFNFRPTCRRKNRIKTKERQNHGSGNQKILIFAKMYQYSFPLCLVFAVFAHLSFKTYAASENTD
jgi:hypothetical protein